jgi:hypothetical protein
MSNFNNENIARSGTDVLHGEYRAIVVDVKDPENLMRAKIRLLQFWKDSSEESLPWAEYKLPIGARFNEGTFNPCLVGDMVWVDFINGDSRCPRITGSCHYAPDGVLNMPHEAFVGDSKHTHKRHEKEPVPDAPIYHEAIVFSRYGILIEGAPDSSYRLTHKPSGTAFEFTKDGHSVLHTEGDSYRSATGKLEENIGGNWSIKVEGNTTIDSKGHVSLKCPSADIGHEGLQPAVLGDDFKKLIEKIMQIFNSHTHIGNMGSPTSIPQTTQEWVECLSPTVNVRK